MSMKMNVLGRWLVLAAIFAVAVPMMDGCRKSPEERAKEEAQIAEEVDQALAQIDETAAADKKEEALALTEKGMRNKKYKAHANRFVMKKVELLLGLNRHADACKIISENRKKDAPLAASLTERVYQDFQSKKMYAEILAWTKELLASPETLPPHQRIDYLFWGLDAALNLKQPDAARQSLTAITEAAPAKDVQQKLEQAFNRAVQKAETAAFVTEAFQNQAQTITDPAYKSLFLRLILQGQIAQKQWPEAAKTFETCIAQMDDEALMRVSRPFYQALRKNDNLAIAETAAATVIKQVPDKKRSAAFAARIWVDAGVKKDPTALPTRLSQLLEDKIDPNQVGGLLDQYFYGNIENKALIKDLCAIGQKLIPICTETNTVNAIKVKILDGAFITENYAVAVEMLEKGIPGKDKKWHEMSLPKVKAHLALQQNNPREAVKCFRAFMEVWRAQEQEEEFDPSTGVAYSKAWILGRNTDRIAGILDSIPDKEEAAKARAEAKAYYKEALEKAAKDETALKLLKEETKAYGL